MTQMIVPPTASQQAAAEALLADPGRWSPGRSKATGQSFWLIQGSAGHAHWATAYGCTCPGYRHRGVCSHVVAVTMREAREAARLNPSELPVIRTTAPAETRDETMARLRRELGLAED